MKASLDRGRYHEAGLRDNAYHMPGYICRSRLRSQFWISHHCSFKHLEPVMEALPPEILVPIIQSVCKDGGRTSCALREVSRYMCSLVEPYRFPNVLILGPGKMDRFLQELQRASVEVRCVRHLFISDQIPVAGEDSLTHENPSLVFITLRRFKPKDPWNKDERSRTLWIHRTLDRICNLCASSILSLTVSFGPTEQLQPHWTWGANHFPLLREFTLVYFDKKEQSGLPSIGYANMPMLETLWISALPRLGALNILEFDKKFTYANGIPKRRIPRLVFEVGPDFCMTIFVDRYSKTYRETPRTDSHSWIFDTVEHHAIIPDKEYNVAKHFVHTLKYLPAMSRTDKEVQLPGNVSLYECFFAKVRCTDIISFSFD
jgi:hypothetical protein